MKIRVPDALTANISEKYNVSIRLNDNSFTFTGYVPGERDSFFRETVPLDKNKSLADSLKDIYFDNECLKYVFKSLNIICVTERYTVIPEDVYSERDKEKLFSLCFTPKENGKIITEDIDNNSFISIFEFDTEAYEFLMRSFINATFRHALSPTLKLWQKNSLATYPKQVYMNVYQGVIDVVCFEHGELLFANSFPYERENDILYFVTYVCKQLNINQLEDELYFCGEISVCRSVMNVLDAYFERINLFTKKMEKYQSPVDEEVPLDIIILTECE
ncbi:MAG: DUF3822 family protein [Tannerella sp.]|jgi:hypothetical protein|nr:DUF3822 family protein [Tannerella sp.]